VNWKGEMKIAGKLASFGAQGLLDRMAQKNVETFIDAIKNGLGEMPAAPPPLSPASS
jgi:carbon monoxide dehydrogenase subunit G